MNKIKRIEYRKFHKYLELGSINESLLYSMCAKAFAVAEEIDRLSIIRHYPDNGKRCDRCCKEYNAITIEEQCEYWMEFIDEGEYGYFECPYCSQIDNWWDYLQSHNWMYSDAHSRISKIALQMENEKQLQAKWLLFERLLQIIHGSGPVANWFIEGGTETLDQYRRDGVQSDSLSV